ncbi:MAG: hypothetical protein ACMVP2_08715 [Imperialibacter sp.]|uniref:hypothetical protein n=1 Tax=Imperialibacter sp. TaxID=2038411 RepID=UPI003A8B82B1
MKNIIPVRARNSFFICILLGNWLTSCSFEEQDVSPYTATQPSSKIQSFSSFEDVRLLSNTYSSKSLEEIIAEEDANGFASFGRLSDEIYMQAVSQNFSSVDELYDFVNNNATFVEIVVEEDGEKSFRRKLQNDPYRYLINQDRIFIIKDDAFKIFASKMISLPVAQLKKLQQMNELDVINGAIGDAQVGASGRTTDLAYDIGSNIVKITANSNERVVLELNTQVNSYNIYAYTQPKCYDVGATVSIKGQRKFLGIWYDDKRTLSGDVKLALDYLFPSSSLYLEPLWLRSQLRFTIIGYGPSREWTQTQWAVVQYNNPITNAGPSIHFGASDSWAKTAASPTLYFQINTSLISI